MVVGREVRGCIRRGERKGVAVAVEMVAYPCRQHGLDSSSALSLMKLMKRLATMAHSVVAVVHQLRTTIFELLDHLLLLSKGKVVYSGASCLATGRLEGCPGRKAVPEQTGIADWIMDTMTQEETRTTPLLVSSGSR